MEKNKIIILVVVIAVVVLILASGAIILIVLHNKKKRKQYNKEVEKADIKFKEGTGELANYLGGIDNVVGINQTGSRVSIQIKDIAAINKNKIDELFQPVVYMSNKITFVIGSKSNEFEQLLKDKLKAKETNE